MNKSLEKELGSEAGEAIRLHRSIMGKAESCLNEAILCGEILHRMKQSMDHGDWLPYIEANLSEISERTIRNYMTCWKNKALLLEKGAESLSDAYSLISNPKKQKKKSNTSDNQDSKSATLADLPSGTPAKPEETSGSSDESTDGAEPEPEPPSSELCETGYPIPKKLMPLWNRRQEAQDVVNAISKAKTAIEKAREVDDLLWRGIDYNRAIAELSGLYTHLSLGKPYAVCTKCQGDLHEQCTFCFGRGFLSKFRYENGTSKADRKFRKVK